MMIREKITSADVWENLHSITQGNVPVGMTEELCGKLAEHLNEAFLSGPTVQFDYKNHEAKTELRTVKLLSLDYLPLPNNSLGYPPGWALHGLDFSRGRDGTEERTFFLSNIQMPEVIFRQPMNTNPFRIKLA